MIYVCIEVSLHAYRGARITSAIFLFLRGMQMVKPHQHVPDDIQLQLRQLKACFTRRRHHHRLLPRLRLRHHRRRRLHPV